MWMMQESCWMSTHRMSTRNSDMTVERVDARAAAYAVLEARRTGQPIACVKSLTSPCAGDQLLVYADGRTRGSLGSVALDESARALGLTCLAEGQPVLQDIEGGSRLFCEPHLSAARLIIVG